MWLMTSRPAERHLSQVMRRFNRRRHGSQSVNELYGAKAISTPALVLNVQVDGRLLIHALTDSHVCRLGLFETVGDAWAAIDDIDCR